MPGVPSHVPDRGIPAELHAAGAAVSGKMGRRASDVSRRALALRLARSGGREELSSALTIARRYLQHRRSVAEAGGGRVIRTAVIVALLVVAGRPVLAQDAAAGEK